MPWNVTPVPVPTSAVRNDRVRDEADGRVARDLDVVDRTGNTTPWSVDVTADVDLRDELRILHQSFRSPFALHDRIEALEGAVSQFFRRYRRDVVEVDAAFAVAR